MPVNFDLLEFDAEDDDLLEQFLAKNEKILDLDHHNQSENVLVPAENPGTSAQMPAVQAQPGETPPAPPLQSVQNVQNYASKLHMLVIPKMYFPGSHVTINYNFGK